MKTSVIQVHDMLSVLTVLGVEKRIGEVPGVESVTVNFAAGSATVRYDETRLEVADIKSHVRQGGYESSGKPLPEHVREHNPAGKPAVESPREAAPGSAPTPITATPKAAPVAPVAPVAVPSPEGSAADGRQSKVGPSAVAGHESHAAPAGPSAMPADMAHEMGHGGTDLPAMVRDMRNRFWICLIFTVPIFFYSPMGLFTPPAPPFDLDINLWLLIFATLAVVYPSWPFFVSA